MSERNGDRARFQKDRKRKLRRRQRIQEFVKALRARSLESVDTRLESHAQIAGAEATGSEARDAPQRDIAPQKKETEESRVAPKKARLVNKAGFKP
ncbi:MAG: hypothetical protein HYZ58_18070 [Acidobacteria bacterium]|nr:hypothetical protein [Acidobacteriota bacterium]